MAAATGQVSATWLVEGMVAWKVEVPAQELVEVWIPSPASGMVVEWGLL